MLQLCGATAFNALSGRKQRCWVHILRHARRGLERRESVSDASGRLGLRVMEKIMRGVLTAARLSDERARRAEGKRLRVHLARWVRVERKGEGAQALRKFLTKHEDELWWWAEVGAVSHRNLA